MSANTTVNASFTKRKFSLSIEATGNGTVYYNSEPISNTNNTFFIEYGSTVSVSIIPDNGHKIASVSLNGANVTENVSDGTFSIPNITGNNTVKVEFEAIPVTTYSLTIFSSAGGSVNYNGAIISDTSRVFSVNEGATTTLAFSPETGFELSSRTVNGTDVTTEVNENTYTLANISQNTTVEATFSKISFVLTIQSAGNGQVIYNATEVSNETKQFTVDYGTTASLILQPEDGHQLAKLSVNGQDVTAAVTNNVYAIANISSATTVNAVFEVIPEKTYVLTLTVGNGGSVSYSGVEVSDASHDFTVSEGSTIPLNITPSIGYRLKSVMVNDKDFTKSVQDNTFTINNISANTSVGVFFEAIPIQSFSVNIAVSSGGQVEYNGTVISNSSRSFTVDEGTSLTMNVFADTQYKLAKVSVNGTDKTSSVSENTLTINNVSSDINVNVAFEMIMEEFSENGIKYGIVSSGSYKVRVLVNNYSGHVIIPSTIQHNNLQWTVTEIASNAFSGNDQLITVSIPPTVENCGNDIFRGCTRLSAIVWQPQQRLSDSQAGYIENLNLLFYTSAENYAPSAVTNVVVDNHARLIKLTENNEFYCPQAFTADKVSFSHHYSMKTGIGESMGWETISLPFNVQTVTHAQKGRIVPFAAYIGNDGTHPFWLYGYDSTSGFIEATTIEANRPYIISMPNNSRYADEYILAGNVEFSSENVTIMESDGILPVTCGDNIFWPSFQATTKDVKALNVNNDFINYMGGLNPGSAFIFNLREVKPFEGYMTSASGNQVSVSVFDEQATSIGVIPEKEWITGRFSVYSTAGQVMKTCEDCSAEEALRGLAPGVYVVKGRKMVVK